MSEKKPSQTGDNEIDPKAASTGDGTKVGAMEGTASPDPKSKGETPTTSEDEGKTPTTPYEEVKEYRREFDRETPTTPKVEEVVDETPTTPKVEEVVDETPTTPKVEEVVELHQTVDRREPQLLDGARVGALEATVQALETSNELLASRLKDAWFWPKFVFAAATAFLTVWVTFNLAMEYLAVSALDSRADDLELAVSDVDKMKVDLEEDLDDLRVQLEASQRETEKLQDDYETLSSSANQNLTSSLKIASFLNLARDQLFYKENPSRALRYASLARQNIDDLVASSSNRSDFAELYADVLTLNAECLFQLSEWEKLRAVVASLQKDGCPSCFETDFYAGALAVYDASRTSERAQVLERARSRFEKALGHRSSQTPFAANQHDPHIATLFLIATALELGDIKLVNSTVETFTNARHLSTGRVRLTPHLRAQVEIANAWGQMARFVSGDESAIEDFGCNFEIGSIGRVEGALFVSFLKQIVANRQSYFDDDDEWDEWRANRLGVFALATAEAIDHATTCDLDEEPSEECTNCDLPEVPDPKYGTDLTNIALEVILKHKLRLPATLPPLTQIEVPYDEAERSRWQRATIRIGFLHFHTADGELSVPAEIVEYMTLEGVDGEVSPVGRWVQGPPSTFREGPEDAPPAPNPPGQ